MKENVDSCALEEAKAVKEKVVKEKVVNVKKSKLKAPYIRRAESVHAHKYKVAWL